MGSYAARTKYDEPGRVERYRHRSPRRDREEWRLLQGVIQGLDPSPEDALDVPCGTGRIAARLLAEGIPTRCADLSPAMRAACEEHLGGVAGFRGVVALDLEAPSPEPALAADLVVCFRLLHHLPDEPTRARVLATLAGLTRRDLLLSFNHPTSAHALTRLVRRLVRGGPSDRYTLRPATLSQEGKRAGLDLVRLHPLGRWRRELWVAHLRLTRAPGGSLPS